MTPLAQLVPVHGHAVQGSDRAFDQGLNGDLARRLGSLGIVVDGGLNVAKAQAAMRTQRRGQRRSEYFSRPVDLVPLRSTNQWGSDKRKGVFARFLNTRRKEPVTMTTVESIPRRRDAAGHRDEEAGVTGVFLAPPALRTGGS